MRLEQSFELQVSVERSWSALLDIELVASCLSGVTLTSFDAESFAGRVTMAMGSVALTIGGSGRFVERDQAGKRIVLVASGQDSSGAGAVAVRVTAVAHSARGGEATTVKIIADVDLTGRAAQLGRGLLTDPSSGVVQRFAERLAAAIGRMPAPDSTVVPAPDLTVMSAVDPMTVAASGPGAAAASDPGLAAIAAHPVVSASVSAAGSGPAGMSVPTGATAPTGATDPAGAADPTGLAAPVVSVLAAAASFPDGTLAAGPVTERIAMQPVALVDETAVRSVTPVSVQPVTSVPVVRATSVPVQPVTSGPVVLATSDPMMLATSGPVALATSVPVVPVTSGAVPGFAGSVTQAPEAAYVEGITVLNEPVAAPSATFVTESVPMRPVAEIDAQPVSKPVVPEYHWLAMAPLDLDAQAQPIAMPPAVGPPTATAQVVPALLVPQALPIPQALSVPQRLLAPHDEPLSTGSDSPEASQLRRTGLYLAIALIILVGFVVWLAAR